MALVLDGDARAALAAVRALGRAGKPVGVVEGRASSPAAGFASRWARFRRVVPDHATEPDAFLAAVLHLLDEHPIGVVLPTADGSVAALAPHRALLAERGATLALAGAEPLAIASDKARTLQAAVELGIPVPQGATIDGPADLAAAEALVGFPAVVKPSRSWADESDRVGRMICALAEDREELRRATTMMLEAGAGPIVQQWLPGRREAIHLIFADGKVWARAAVASHRTAPPLGGNSVLRETIPLPEDTTEYAERLIRSLGHEGYAEVEFRRDASGVPVLMEINPRLSASVDTAILAGVDFPNLIYAWAQGLPLSRVRGYRAGVRLRWLGGDLRWLRDTLRSQGQPDVEPLGRALATFAGDFVRPTRYDWFALDDPLPGVAATGTMSVKAVRRAAQRLRRSDRRH